MSNNSKYEHYLNRELSWLEFNQRVLDQARLQETPLLERLKFLAITGSNLDEFFMVRVGGLLIQSRVSPETLDVAGLRPDEQLDRINRRVRTMMQDQYQCFNHELLPALAEQDIRRLAMNELDPRQQAHLGRLFDEEVSALISPIAVNESTDFPLMTSAPLGLCVNLRGATLRNTTDDSDDNNATRFAIITLARSLPRIVSVPSKAGFHFVLLEDLVCHFVGRLFPKQTVEECVAFRATRNADIAVDIDAAADLLSDMQVMLDARKTSECVRLEIASDASAASRQFLQECLLKDDNYIYLVPGPINLAAFMGLATIKGHRALNFEPWPPQPSPDFRSGDDLFEVIAADDRLLIHPYQVYDPVIEFVETAAADPDVIAIKQTLYRTSQDSPVIAALREAAENGKHVTAIVELRARFDEQQNIGWAKQLEKSGVDVVYGVRGLKTHAKICLVVRRETGGIQRYTHFGTGNYNESTARIYSDVSFFTRDPQLGADAVNFFNAVTGLSIPQTMQKLVAAPIDLRERLLELIDVETQNARNRRPAAIRAKTNSLVDRKVIDALYAASQAGVQIDLNVRGICCLRPGVAGLSENIRVVSIVDRFLEHARIFYFLHGGDHRVFISSADWMVRNLQRRVELMIPIEHAGCKQRLIAALNCYLTDNVKAKRLLPDGSFEPVTAENQVPIRSQQVLYSEACQLHQTGQQTSRTIFEPHRAGSERGDSRSRRG